jgi:hypothetical protein
MGEGAEEQRREGAEQKRPISFSPILRAEAMGIKREPVISVGYSGSGR